MISAIYLILFILQETTCVDGLLIMDILLFKLAWQDYTSTLAHAAQAYMMMVLSFGCMSDRWLSLAYIYGKQQQATTSALQVSSACSSAPAREAAC